MPSSTSFARVEGASLDLENSPSSPCDMAMNMGLALWVLLRPMEGLTRKGTADGPSIDNVSVCICCFFGIEFRLAVSQGVPRCRLYSS